MKKIARRCAIVLIGVAIVIIIGLILNNKVRSDGRDTSADIVYAEEMTNALTTEEILDHIVYRDDFDKAREELETKSNKITADIKKAFKELNQLEADSRQIQKYLENMQAHKRYTQTNDKNEKYDLNDANRNYESAVVYIEKNNIRAADITYANLDKINTRIEVLYQKIDELKDSRKSTREDIRRLDIIRKNNEEIFGKEITRPVSEEQDKEAQSQR